MSSHYKQLVSCEKRLRRTFITETVKLNPTTKTSQFKILSYRLLAHAEIEYYIENCILAKVKIEKEKYVSRGVISPCIASLIAYSNASFPKPACRLADVSTRNDLGHRINYVLSKFENNIRKNNGIKEQDVIPLLISIGIDYNQISQTLLNNLSSYGRYRGAAAHQSTKIQQLINPNDEISILNQIITQLEDIDKLIINI